MQVTEKRAEQLPVSRWLRIFGIVFLLGGIVALTVPATASIAIELLLGWLFFVGGCIQLGAVFTVRMNHVFWFKLPWALLFLLVGLWLILRPAEGVQALALVVGFLFLIEAILKLVSFWRWRNMPKIRWTLLSGILSLIIAMILLTGWPQQSAVFLGILVGVNLLTNGVVSLLLSSGIEITIIENT